MAIFLSGGCLYIKKPPERIRCLPKCCRKLKPNKVCETICLIKKLRFHYNFVHVLLQLCTEDIELDTLLDAESTADESDTDETVEKHPKGDSVVEIEPDLDEISDSADQHVQLLNESTSPPPSSTAGGDQRTEVDQDVADKSSATLKKLKQLMPILKVFMPLIVFWAVFYQRSSTWIVQATQMDCYLGSLHVPPGE